MQGWNVIENIWSSDAGARVPMHGVVERLCEVAILKYDMGRVGVLKWRDMAEGMLTRGVRCNRKGYVQSLSGADWVASLSHFSDLGRPQVYLFTLHRLHWPHMYVFFLDWLERRIPSTVQELSKYTVRLPNESIWTRGAMVVRFYTSIRIRLRTKSSDLIHSPQHNDTK